MKKLSSVSSQENITGLEFQIKKIARDKGIKIYELAEAIGKKSTYISKIESGNVNTTINVIQSIADALGVSVHELIKLPEGYEHHYGETSKEWLGIRKI